VRLPDGVLTLAQARTCRAAPRRCSTTAAVCHGVMSSMVSNSSTTDSFTDAARVRAAVGSYGQLRDGERSRQRHGGMS